MPEFISEAQRIVRETCEIIAESPNGRVRCTLAKGSEVLTADGILYRGTHTDEWRIDLEGFTVCFTERDFVEILLHSTGGPVIRLFTKETPDARRTG